MKSVAKMSTRALLAAHIVAIILSASLVAALSSTSSIRGGSRAEQTKRWRRWAQQRRLARELRDNNEAEERRRHIEQRRAWRRRKLEARSEQSHEQDERATLQSRIMREVEAESAIYRTIRRSLDEKYHIEWQLEQLELRQQWQEARLFPLEARATTDAERYTYEPGQRLGERQNHPLRRRKLDDSFDNAYNTGRPGSTYGNQMFCGSSWAEASTSCEVRQNCPSGQSDECIMPGQECWAFTECDTRKGHGEQFGDMHGVSGAENLHASGIGAEASGGFVDLSKPSNDKTDHYFCGKGYDDAVSKCASHCPSGSLNDCPPGEICFFNTPCDARMMTRAPSPPSPTQHPTTPSPVVYTSKLNKYSCGYDWDDAQGRCEIWCPSGSDEDCPDDMLCFAFSQCHAVDMNMQTLAQMEKQKLEYQQLNQQNTNNNVGGGGGGDNPAWWEPGSGGSGGGGGGSGFTMRPTAADEVPGYYDVTLGGTKRPTRNPTKRPTNKPVMSAEQAMHRYSFCGAFWTDARDNCETKQHCEDDKDCPEFEYCWTQTPCDYYATSEPTTAPPTTSPTLKPTTSGPTVRPTQSPIGTTPTRPPTPEPTWEPTVSPTYIPTQAPTITAKPTDKPTFDPDDPSLTFFCGFSWAHADETCGMRCPSGNSGDCPAEFECWAFTSCDEERGIKTSPPTVEPSPAPMALYVPGYGGAQVPVFGGTDFSQFEPTVSPAPTTSGMPSEEPSRPPAAVAKETMATYYCGKDWNDVEKNCHQACPSGSNMECEDPEHSCWAFVHACRAKTQRPTASPVTKKPTLSPVTSAPTRDPGSPTTPQPTDPPTDLYGLLEASKGRFYCAERWDMIVCGDSASCASGDDNDCPSGQSCFSSEIDCSQPQPLPSEPPMGAPRPPTRPPAVMAGKPTLPSNGANESPGINNQGENWDSDKEQQIDNSGENWQQIDNSGEDWNTAGNQQQIDNAGEDWGSTGVNNDGEEWSQTRPTSAPSTRRPTNKPSPRAPTPDPTPDPTIDLMTHLENLKNSYYCSESWDNIDCENAQPCPSGNSRDCPKKQQCFSGTPCRPKEEPAPGGESTPGQKPNGGKPGSSSPGDNFKPELNEITSKFFCGASWAQLVDNCERAKPCPTGTNAECDGGQNCFANTPCGKPIAPVEEEVTGVGIFNFAAMVDKVPGYCKDGKTMSRNVGYWQSWSIYRDDACNPFTAGSIDASSYTHLVFSFASISDEGTLEPWDFEEDIKGGQYQQFLDVKQQYPDTKTMVAVGGWTHNEPDNERLYRFSESAATPKARMKFAQSSVAFLRKYGFDGLDVDWEYPGDETRGGNATVDKQNLVLLADELRKYFDDAPEKFELSLAIPASIARYEVGFDLKSLAKSVHFFNLMAYDLHGVWDDPPITGAHSDIGGINAAVDYITTNSSVPPSQIVLGMPAYGRSYTMTDETCLALGCPFNETSNETAIGGCLDTNGFVPFVEIYEWQEQGVGKGFDSMTVDLASYSAVMIKDDDQLISYDNAETFKAKVDYATNKCLGGTMIWAIDMLPLGTQSAGSRVSGSGSGGGGASSGGGGGTGSGVGGGRGEGGAADNSATASILSVEDAALAFCGKDWDDAVSTCSRPCPTGLSDDCEPGETCFAGTPCGAGGVIAAGDTCRICPDSTSQGILTWVEVEVEIEGTTTSTTCGELDYGVLRSVTKDSEVCDEVKLEYSQECCYTYPQDPCGLCRKGPVYYNVRSELNVTMHDGNEASCGLVDKMLAPEENGGQQCVKTQDALFDACCYKQCSLCEGQGIKWWVDFDELQVSQRRAEEDRGDDAALAIVDNDEGKTCSSIDAALYSDFVEADTEQCFGIKSRYSTDCCYSFPQNPCGLCQKDDTTQTLLWANEVEHEGRNVTCGVIDNILNAEEQGSPTCNAAKDDYFSSCCFDKCSLCDNAQLAWDFVVDYKESTKTCGDIEAIFAAEETQSNSKECVSIKADYQDLCCFTPPITPCEMCPEYVRWDEAVEFDGSETTCKQASAMLKRAEEFSDICIAAKEDMADTCCYELCDICGESMMLDWDAVVEYEGERIACGDFKPIFGRNEIEEGTEQCSAVKDTYADLCCYTPPSIPCNLCETETDFFDAYSSVEVDFWGSAMNCSDVYDYLIRRVESDSQTCSSAREAILDQCCYKKCPICGDDQLQDFDQSIDLEGDIISCQQLHLVRTTDVAFSNTCCYDAPDVPCVLCAEGAVRKELQVDFNGDTESCEQVANFLGNRANNGTEECAASKAEFQDFCCFDKCSICGDGEEIDWDAYVDFDGKEGVSCGSFDWYFTSNAIEEGTEQCTDLQLAYRETCCYQPIDYSTPACSLCKHGDAWYDINGDVEVYFEGSNRTCTEVSNSLFRKFEDDSGFCNAAKAEYFPSCCFAKCDLCQGAQLDANVEVAYDGDPATCLELGLRFAADIVMEGSEECNAARQILYEPCCYSPPTDACVLCQSDQGSQGDVRDGVSVSFYGSTTTCFELNSFLVSREEQVGFMCQAAKTELQESCCFQECSVCGSSGNLYWDNPTTFNGITFACGELSWILSGNSVEEGSLECNQMQSAYYDDCCSGPSALVPNADNKCEICPSGKDWYAQIVYNGKPMTCLELDTVLLQDGVFDTSPECSSAIAEYSSQCCYVPPENPCNLCHSGQNSYSVKDHTVEYNGAKADCFDIYNYLWTRIETEDDACLVTQNDLFDECCYSKCSMCGDYQLDQAAMVVHEGTPMGCSEIEDHFIGLNQITQESEECATIQQDHWNTCCYDIECDLCSSEEDKHELLVDEAVIYMGVNRTCGDWSVLAEADLSQTSACKATKDDLFHQCCFRECNLCKDPGSIVNWNHQLTYEGLPSTCLDVFMNLRSERVQGGDDRCQSVQFAVANECCDTMPSNQCSLCQSTNGTYLNTNWNAEVTYQGEAVTCSDVNAMLSSEEMDSILCQSAREDLWIECCTPQEGGNTGLGGILPTLAPGVSDGGESGPSDWDSGAYDTGFAGTTFYRRNASGRLQPLCALAMPLLGSLAAFIIFT
ncbi:hypothetical protein ACHAXT_011419 [Thalassiosira profunda]